MDGPNLLLDDTLAGEVDKGLLGAVRDSIVQVSLLEGGGAQREGGRAGGGGMPAATMLFRGGGVAGRMWVDLHCLGRQGFGLEQCLAGLVQPT